MIYLFFVFAQVDKMLSEKDDMIVNLEQQLKRSDAEAERLRTKIALQV